MFHTERDEYWKIESLGGAPNTSGQWWRVTSKDGTQYSFGYNPDSEHMNGYYAGWYPYKWSLDQIRDTSGNTINFEYYEEQVTPGDEPAYCQASYLRRISYAGDTVEVAFHRTSRNDWEEQGGAYYKFVLKEKLDSIDVRVKVGANWQMVRKYVPAYGSYTGTEPWWHKGHRSWNQSDPRFDEQYQGKVKLLLTSITQCGRNATYGVANGAPSGDTLPATTFTYETGTNKKCRLLTASNGYGGQVTYAYESFTPTGWLMIKWRYKVNQRSLADGLTSANNYMHYYGTPRQAPDRDDHPDFRGHDYAKVVDPAGHFSLTYFYTYGAQNNKSAADVDILKGLTYLVEERDSGNGLHRRVENIWNYTQIVPGTPSANFLHLDQVDSYAYPGAKLTRVQYSYDTYGNREIIKELADGSPTAQKRTTKRSYFHNTSQWILDMLSMERVYEGDQVLGDGQEKKLTQYAYDQFGLGSQNYGQAPSKGLVTGIRRHYQISASLAYYHETLQDYDTYGNRTKVRDGRENTTTTTYEGTYHTYPTRVDYPIPGLYEARDYDYVVGRLTRVTDANAQYTDYQYDNLGRLRKVIRPGDDAALPTIEYVYRASPLPFRLETIRKKNGTDPRYTARTFYDGLGREVQRYSDAVSGHTGLNTYCDSRGLKRRETIPHAVTGTGSFLQSDWTNWQNQAPGTPGTDTQYDALRRPNVVTNPDDTQQTTSYNGWDLTQFDENSHKKVQKMDAFGRMVIVEEYTGNSPSNYAVYATTNYEYDVLDNLTTVTDGASPTRNVTTMAYDSLSRKTGMTDPDMGAWSYGYDAVGNLISQTDAKGQAMAFTYDELNRMTRKYYPAAWVDDPLTTNHSPGVFDLMELRAAVDVNRLAAGFNPDVAPWTNPAIVAGKDVTIRAVHFTEMRTRTQDLWTAAGIGSVPEFSAGPIVAQTRLISLRDPTDLRGWLTSNPTNYEGSAWASQNGRRARAAYRFDNYSDGLSRGYPKGRRTELWDVCGRTRWTYDSRGRIIVEEKWIDGQLYTTQWSYDAMDRVVSLTYPDGEVVSYGYNAQLLLASMSGYITGTTYNALGQPTQINLGNGRVTDMQYCWLEWAGKVPFGAIAWIKTTKAGLPNLQDLQYTYDNVGNPTQIYDPRNGETVNYGYDDLDRLVTASAPINGSYSYNQIANLLSKTEGGVTYNLDYTGTAHKHAPVSVNGVPYTYDNNGDLTNRSGVDYKYDAENRLVKVSQGSAYVARMAYDGDGRRAKRLDGYGTVHYVGPHYERNVGTGADTTEVITKLYWVQLGSYRRLIAVSRAGLLYYVHSDHLGGTNILSDVSGNEVGALRYYAFGQTRVQTGLVPTDKLYTGQTLDASSGLYHYGARYYDAALGRFVQPDSVVPQPGNPQSLNRYAYALNNPLKYTDPTGHAEINILSGRWWLEGGGGGGAGGIGILILGYLALTKALQVASEVSSRIEFPTFSLSSPFEGTQESAKGRRRDPVQEGHDKMVDGLSSPKFVPGQLYIPPGGWNLDPKGKAKWLAILAAVGFASFKLAKEKGLSLSQQASNPFGQGPDFTIEPLKGDGPSWRATGDWAGWTEQFYDVHGHLPGLRDVFDREWSLGFLTKTGHAPTGEDWQRYSEDPSYIGK